MFSDAGLVGSVANDQLATNPQRVVACPTVPTDQLARFMKFIDTHCHLDESAFEADIAAVVQRAVDAGVARMITIGITADTSRAAVELAQRFDEVYAVVGIQPNYASQVKSGDWEAIEEMASEFCVVGVGETGLDRYWDYAPIDIQSEFFVRHLDLSRRIDKPFVVHCRDAEDDVVTHLKNDASNGPMNGLMHSFCGDQSTLDACLELGMSISLAGMVTYPKNAELRAVAANVPLDRLLIETDAPYLTPHPTRKKCKRNEPAFVTCTAECLAEVHGTDVATLARHTTQNAKRIFGLDLV